MSLWFLVRNLNETLQIQRFRVKAKVTPDAEEEILAQFFHDERVQSTLSVGFCLRFQSLLRVRTATNNGNGSTSLYRFIRFA